MKRIVILISVIGLVALAISCATQVEPTAQFSKTSATFAISSTVTAVTAASKDSLTGVLPITWNNPKYAVGLSQSMFTVEVAKTGTNFAKFETRSFTGVLTGSLLAKDLNKIALQLGGAVGQSIGLDIKVVASLENNNEQLTSNVIQATVTPYSDLQLTASSTNVVTTADNATQVGLTLSWNAGFAGYEGTRTYQFQYAQGGTNFASPVLTAETTTSQSYTQLDLNNIAALDYGVAAGSTGTVDFRVMATNGLNAVIYSNTVTVTITPYSSKPVPKYPVPDSLYLVGSASPGGWSNPVPWPSQKFTKIDANTFGMIVQLSGGTDYSNGNNSYLLLPVNGDWTHKYSITLATTSANPMGDAFQPDSPNNIPGPTAAGLYEIIVDFVKGTYTLTLITGNNPVPDSLYIVGDATPGGSTSGWNNPVPVPQKRFKKVSNAEFQLSIALTSTGSYLFLPVNGDWTHKYGGSTNGTSTPGALLADGAVPGSNTPPPATSGTYTVTVNFLTNTYSLTQ